MSLCRNSTKIVNVPGTNETLFVKRGKHYPKKDGNESTVVGDTSGRCFFKLIKQNIMDYFLLDEPKESRISETNHRYRRDNNVFVTKVVQNTKHYKGKDNNLDKIASENVYEMELIDLEAESFDVQNIKKGKI